MKFKTNALLIMLLLMTTVLLGQDVNTSLNLNQAGALKLAKTQKLKQVR